MRVLNNKYATLVGIAVVVYLGYSLAQKIPAYLALRGEVNYVDKNIAETKDYKIKLEEESLLLDNETYLEQQARIKLNYKKPGEQVVYVYRQDYAVTTPVPENLSFWKKLVKYFSINK